ncbi:class I adenylate-forming enzyme family protein [Fusibacter sp. 3D3]|uniref:class I adenylate-forming enzyme family protein n=1 Tax=Fusibacter sp. 3D3 TaxID=1048380 RepID=UPI000853ED1D|nr:class I adenylate-forming enzyme family protein [Fusibacter sp. 3D3]GAU80039.1 long-chain-fatty-acid-CoA ligase [Fusibacter sp. 3D3]
MFRSHLNSIFVSHCDDSLFYDVERKQSISYSVFLCDVKKVIEKIQNSYEKSLDIVSALNNNYTTLVLYFAAFMLGRRLILIEPLKGKNEFHKMLAISNNPVIFCDIVGVDSLHFTSEDINKWIKEELSRNSQYFNLDIETSLIHLSELVTFTSGTTDVPKAVLHTFDNLAQSAISFSKQMEFDHHNIFIHTFPMCYMAGVLNSFVLPLFLGGKCVIGERFGINTVFSFWDNVISNDVDVIWFNPTMLEIITKMFKNKSEEISKYCVDKKVLGIVATAPLTEESWKNFENIFSLPLYNSYGLSETLFISTNAPKFKNYSSVGKILEGVDVKILEGSEVGLKVKWRCIGYLNNNIENNLEGNYYKSGDIGIVNKQMLHITGRIKDLIIRGGLNINPFVIEHILKKSIGSNYVIIGAPDRILGEKILMVVEGNKLDTSLRTLNKLLEQELGNEFKIDEIKTIDKIPVNSNGKLDRKNILEKLNDIKN